MGSDMTDHQQRSAEQLFKDKAVTLAQTGQDVQVMCNSAEDAEVVFNWLEQQICNPQTQPPFPDGCRIRATRDATEIPFWEGSGEALDGDVCMEEHAYRVRTCFWHAAHKWLVQIGEARFKAEAFEPAQPALPGDPPPFPDKAVVKSLRSAAAYTDEGWLLDNCWCPAGYQYVVDTCSIRPDGGWFVVISGDLHLAEDFKLWDDNEEDN